MFEQANEPLWDGAKRVNTFSIATSLLNWKLDCNITDSTFDKLLSIIKEILPDGNIDKWPNRSKARINKRKNDLSRHTGWSMGFNEHRIRFDKQKNKMADYELVFTDIHATKETKQILQEGEINVNDLEELEFVMPQSKESSIVFHNELVKEYGSNNDHNADHDEFVAREHLHPNSRGWMFGVGSSVPFMDQDAACTAKESLELVFQMSNILDTGLDRHTLSVLIALCDLGLNPEALAAVVKEFRKDPSSTSRPSRN
ncbi:hypothetical protein E3N88_08546 [Mikania micrantha]|uniref:Uncharacterized protein n=1 Tax=Mikania micrantha TaxID=192012 RepID=A0A5N6PGI2_9ASTR|nr:hypothetical protein E3N88_08546 [Mikania micrantha]